MNWRFKEEPENYNFDALVKDARTVWSGVKNPVAQRHLHAIKRGDRILYYHTGKEKAIVGIAKALGDSYTDPGDKTGKHAVVEVGPVRKLGRPVTLAEIRPTRRSTSACRDFAVVGDANHRQWTRIDQWRGGRRGRVPATLSCPSCPSALPALPALPALQPFLPLPPPRCSPL
jgi:predicted RNA-binding protein with PUA-like domain